MILLLQLNLQMRLRLSEQFPNRFRMDKKIPEQIPDSAGIMAHDYPKIAERISFPPAP